MEPLLEESGGSCESLKLLSFFEVRSKDICARISTHRIRKGVVRGSARMIINVLRVVRRLPRISQLVWVKIRKIVAFFSFSRSLAMIIFHFIVVVSRRSRTPYNLVSTPHSAFSNITTTLFSSCLSRCIIRTQQLILYCFEIYI